MYVCNSVRWLTSLLKLDIYRDISSPEWYIFLKMFGGIPGMFVHYFHMLTNFLYVCQSISLLTSLLKLDIYRDIFCSGWDIFLIFLDTFLGCFYSISKYLWISCLSVSLSVGLLPYWNQAKTGISLVLDEISFWNL